MKKIEAIFRPERLPVVRKALLEAGYDGLTITDVRGHGSQKGLEQMYRGEKFFVDILPKVKVELVVPDAAASKIVKAIVEGARTGAIGDGKVFVSNIEDAVRVRTGESGEKAIS